MDQHANHELTVGDLSGVVFSAGRAFNDLSVSRPATDEFLRTGSMEGITTEHDLALLEDPRDLAQLVLDHGQGGGSIDTGFVRGVNARITRSGALHPGKLRRNDQRIGVSTRYGEYMPPAITETNLEQLLNRALSTESPLERALNLFVDLAKAQPFEDGNKRTALFVANGLLIRERAQMMLSVPLIEAWGKDENRVFSVLLARSYIFGEDGAVKRLLRERGLSAGW